MSKPFFLKVLGISLSLVMVINFILLFLGRVPLWWFWSIVVFCGVMAWVGLPLLRRMS